MSTIKVDTVTTLDGTGNITLSRPLTGLSGSGASLTALNATQLTSGTLPMARLSGTLPALNGSALTALNATQLTSGTLPIARIADGAITAAKIGGSAVTTTEIATGSVTTDKIAADAVNGTKIADDAINSEHYAAASIDNEHLADDAVGIAELSATGTASNSTYLRGDNSWATVSGGGGGKVLQVLNAVKTDVSSIASTTYADISGLSLTITPSATTSKILFIMNVSIGCGNDANHVYLNMIRGSTAILVGNTAGSRTSSTNLVNTTGIGQQITASATYLDSPSTTSATTYKIQWKNNGSYTNYVNRATRDNNHANYDGRVTSQITLMEIGA